jgi:3-hydroxybutyryl-CoA dehydrogenase
MNSCNDIPASGVQTIGIAGLGFLGRGIAACLLAHEFRVVGLTAGEPHTFERARKYISDAISELIERGGYRAGLASDWPNRFVEAGSFSEFANCDFVIESLPEDLAVKRSVFDQLEAIVSETIPIASNTSALPIGMLQENRRYPSRFLGMHWAEPAYVTRFLELIRGPHTSDEAMRHAAAIAMHAGKEPCFVNNDVPGFLVNRIAYAMYREAVHLLEIGAADADTIDRACRNAFGLWSSLCGPLRWIDITGGPAPYGRAMSGVLPHLCNSAELPETIKTMMDRDDRGLTNGRGFFSYGSGDAKTWEQRLHEQAWAVRLSSA